MNEPNVFKLTIDGKRYRLLCQNEDAHDFSFMSFSSCPVPQIIQDAIHERLGKQTFGQVIIDRLTKHVEKTEKESDR